MNIIERSFDDLDFGGIIVNRANVMEFLLYRNATTGMKYVVELVLRKCFCYDPDVRFIRQFASLKEASSFRDSLT